MPLLYHHPADVLQFAADCIAQGTPYALVMASQVTGGTMRGQGAMMCVTPETSAGYISNGCVDGDIIFQARAAIEKGQPISLRYGEGSPFKDITLPCGGRIDLHVRPDMPSSIVLKAADDLQMRRSTALEISPSGQIQTYSPQLKLRIAGRGQAALSLASQALGAGFDAVMQSPDKDLLKDFNGSGFDHLIDPEHLPLHQDDKWTAVILMFHDHEWEPEILKGALAGEAFYIGAMGSARTHKIRTETLLGMGISPGDIARIKAPIGVIPSMRDANLLALSTLAEIVQTAHDMSRL